MIVHNNLSGWESVVSSVVPAIVGAASTVWNAETQRDIANRTNATNLQIAQMQADLQRRQAEIQAAQSGVINTPQGYVNTTSQIISGVDNTILLAGGVLVLVLLLQR